MERFGDWAVVTGANSGIGAAFAAALAWQGYRLVLVGRRAEALAETAARLTTETRVITADLAEPGAAARIAAETAELDVGLLISNAGEITMGSVLTTPLEVLQRSLQLNAAAHLDLVHHFGNRFAARGRGGILMTSTLAGLQPVPWSATYGAAKAFVLNLGMALHHELRNKGVHVTVLVPGPVKTPGLKGRGPVPIETNAPAMSPEAVVARALSALNRNQPVVIPGALPKTVALTSRLIGRRLATRMFAAMMKGTVPAHARHDAGID